MKKSILNLGTPISRNSQQLILGGNNTGRQCEYGTCPDNLICYYNQSGGTFCGYTDSNVITVEEPWKPKGPRLGTDG